MMSKKKKKMKTKKNNTFYTPRRYMRRSVGYSLFKYCILSTVMKSVTRKQINAIPPSGKNVKSKIYIRAIGSGTIKQ